MKWSRLMKKIIMSLIVLFALSINAFAIDAVYRISSGEVLGIGTTSSLLFDLNEYTAIATDVVLIDGAQLQSPDGNWRVPQYSKIYDNGEVRNATQEEIDTFVVADRDDHNIQEASQALNDFQNNPKLRRIMTAFAAILVNEINILRAEHGLPDRTLSQFKTAIQNRISKDD